VANEVEKMDLMTKVQNLLESSITPSKVEVNDLTGTKDHLEIIISSPQFEGLSLIKQHQLVMDVLKEEFKQELHAVKIKTISA
jgi:stress-induced morphogen